MSKFVVYISREELFIMTTINESDFVDFMFGLHGPGAEFERKEIDDLYVHAHLDDTKRVY